MIQQKISCFKIELNFYFKAAYFILYRNINRIEFYDILNNIVLGFNKLTSEEILVYC